MAIHFDFNPARFLERTPHVSGRPAEGAFLNVMANKLSGEKVSFSFSDALFRRESDLFMEGFMLLPPPAEWRPFIAGLPGERLCQAVYK